MLKIMFNLKYKYKISNNIYRSNTKNNIKKKNYEIISTGSYINSPRIYFTLSKIMIYSMKCI